MIVVDASVALKWVLDEPGFEAARRLRDETIIAPRFWLLECANALWKIARRGGFSRDVALEKLSILQAAPVGVEDQEIDIVSALEIANALGHPVYDCLYLALALREGIQMITADRRFFSVASGVVRLSRSIVLLDLDSVAGVR